jgi:hypothetical protein
VNETVDLSTKILTLLRIVAAVNGGLATMGVAIAYYVYVYVPHFPEVHYAARNGEVVSSAAMYISIFPAFQVFLFLMSAIPACWSSYRRYFLRLNLEIKARWQGPIFTDEDLLYRLVFIGLVGFELIALVGTASRSVVLATQVV